MVILEKFENNNALDILVDKIENKTAVIGVVGLGYVGLPLAVEQAKAGYKVIGFDVVSQKVHMVNRGINYIRDVANHELADVVDNGMLSATMNYHIISQTDVVMICVPTPLDKYQQPDISFVENSSRKVAQHLRKGMLVVLESTTYPGTTEEVVKPILEKSGLRCGEDFFLAFSPERVDPGNKVYNTRNTPKVVGGVTPQCTEIAATLYRNVLEGGVFKVSSPKVAEMEKLLENTFRNINIALVNEMAILCRKMGIDVWEIIDAAKTKPYGFMAFYPGPGLGGHCIPIDPFYLTWKAREFDYHTRLIELAGEINNYMPEFVVERTAKILNNFNKPLRKAKVLVLGIAYKKDIDDLRESPALKIIDQLENYSAEVLYYDPFIPEFTHKARHYKSIELTAEILKNIDIGVIITDHSNVDYEYVLDNVPVVFDTRNVTKNLKRQDKVIKL